ncbi:hypothetical protein FA13DRAFT_1721436 [Coprinellus micaceus]|uniref:Fungal-type protein kinase domain-containing protein n=1 Tax=Coprinellus micaceus TaxID=71717 RepID=A0A4Y7S109_COPMI|nr:hypothetical protein FA13DRAFT_1721436 [Coprinellus micaceus]
MENRPETQNGAEGEGEEETRPRFTTTTDAYAHDIYRDAVEDHAIHEFLNEVADFSSSQRRWSTPELATSNENLLGAVSRIFSAIVQRFAGLRYQGSNEMSSVPAKYDRWIKEATPSRATLLPFSAAESTLGTAASVGTIGYTNIASFSIVKLESEIGTALENLEEAEVHARRIFQVQPNRSYVRSLVITEKHARLVHFDCSGSQVTPLIDIHQHPETLVRLVAGLASADERLLGLDDSVQWTILNGKKAQGHVTTTSPTGETKTYPIVEQIPIPRYSICSRGTTCWRVRDPATMEEYVIKDSWREDDLPAEHELLEKVKGIPGVVFMASCEVDRGETKGFQSVEHFSSVLQVLYAFRDAIVAHQRLLERGVLHRDISLGNVLFGKPDAPEGERGVLIDLDLAFLATDARPSVKSDHTIGTRLFQSISVLHSGKLGELAWEHDYLDDLESFLYSLAFIVLCYRPDGRPIPTDEDGPSIPWSWAEEAPEDACAKKRPFLGVGTVVFRASHAVETIWGPVCDALLSKFRRWIFQMRTKKGTLIHRGRGSAGPLDSFHACRDEHYSAVVGMFDEAIDSVRSAVTSPPPPPIDDVAPAQDVSAPTPLLPAELNVAVLPDPALSPPTPALSPIITQRRRSARTVHHRCALIQNRSPQTQPLDQTSTSSPSAAIQVRRSARIEKRRREEAESHEIPIPKVRRTRQAPRPTKRPC